MADRHGLVNRGRKRRYKTQGTTPPKPLLPNDLWCADYKGKFKQAKFDDFINCYNHERPQQNPAELSRPSPRPIAAGPA